MQFNPNLFDKKLNTEALLDELCTSFCTSGQNRIHKKVLRLHLNIVCNNLIQLDENQHLSLSVANRPLPNNRYNRYKLSVHSLKKIVDELDKLNYIHMDVGEYKVSKSKITPTNKFFRLFPFEHEFIVNVSEWIILRDQDKSLKDYKDNRYTRMSRVIVEKYNEMLDKTPVTLGDKVLKNQYYRIFNQDFTSGGRYYRADILSLSRDERLSTLIDGEPVCEVDYTAMTVAMLLAKEGKSLNYDPYAFCNREDAKKVLNVMLCTGSREAARKAVQGLINFKDVTYQGKAIELISEAERANGTIKHHFYSNIGLTSQFDDSEIASDVITTCVNLGVPVLVLHDGFLCKELDKNIVVKCMGDSFRDYFHCDVDIHMKVENKQSVEKVVDSKEEFKYDDFGNRLYKR